MIGRFLLFTIMIGVALYIIYVVLKSIYDYFNFKRRVLEAKYKKEIELNEEEADILVDDINKKTLKDRYKDKELKNEAIKKKINSQFYVHTIKKKKKTKKKAKKKTKKKTKKKR